MILSSSSDSCLEFEEFQQQKKVVVILFVVYCKENDLSFGPDMGRQRRNRSDEPCIRFFGAILYAIFVRKTKFPVIKTITGIAKEKTLTFVLYLLR